MRDLEMARAEGEVWRSQARSYVEGLAVAIETQFESWTMTDAEREVGLLMLKGFSHKEIAALRGTTEATVRQQARAIYQKAGLPGRAAFSAYFLEDLLPTTNERGTKGPQQFTDDGNQNALPHVPPKVPLLKAVREGVPLSGAQLRRARRKNGDIASLWESALCETDVPRLRFSCRTTKRGWTMAS